MRRTAKWAFVLGVATLVAAMTLPGTVGNARGAVTCGDDCGGGGTGGGCPGLPSIQSYNSSLGEDGYKGAWVYWTWSAPSGSEPFASFTWYQGGTEQAGPAIVTSGSTSHVHLTGLSASTTYTYIVAIGNCDGGASDPGSFTTTFTVSSFWAGVQVSKAWDGPQNIGGYLGNPCENLIGTIEGSISDEMSVSASAFVFPGGTAFDAEPALSASSISANEPAWTLCYMTTAVGAPLTIPGTCPAVVRSVTFEINTDTGEWNSQLVVTEGVELCSSGSAWGGYSLSSSSSLNYYSIAEDLITNLAS